MPKPTIGTTSRKFLGKPRVLRRARVEKLLEKGGRLEQKTREAMRPLFMLTESEVSLKFV